MSLEDGPVDTILDDILPATNNSLIDDIKACAAKRAPKCKFHRARVKYKPKFCQMLVDHMAQGFSFNSFGAVVGASKETLKDWLIAHPLFEDARRLGMSACELHWEQMGQRHIEKDAKTFAQMIWKFNMQHRFGWSESTQEGSQEPPKATFVFEPMKDPRKTEDA